MNFLVINLLKIQKQWKNSNSMVTTQCNIVTQLLPSMGIIANNQLQVKYFMGGENAYTWHDHMCHTLITM